MAKSWKWWAATVTVADLWLRIDGCMTNASGDLPPWTIPALIQAKQNGQRFTMLTAYDAGFARVLDANGIDLILVGDSLGMVVQGHSTTLPVTAEQMQYHTQCVARAVRRALLVADLPFQTDRSAEQAINVATHLLRCGAQMVKLEGADFKTEIIAHLVQREIPVCAHLGLTPQSVLRLGGFKVQGQTAQAAEQLCQQAQEVVRAGASLLVLECVPAPLAAQLARELTIPVIGIGAGPGCDGQVLVLHDFLGLVHGDRRPRFVKDFLAEGGSVAGAVQAYVQAVQHGTFPGPEHSYFASQSVFTFKPT